MPRHALGLDDHVLQNLVQPGAEMNCASGVRRAIMQHKQRLALARGQNLLVQIRRLPGLELLGLVLREAGLHRKISLRQVQCLFQFQWFGHGFGQRMSLLIRHFQCIWRVNTQRCKAGNFGKQSNYVCYNIGEVVSAEGSRNLSQPARIIRAKVNRLARVRVYIT